MQQEKCDVLIIGGGGAALRAAIAARENCRGRVVLVTKGALGHSGCTAIACSDRMAFHATLPYTEPGGQDNWRYHADDIYRLGGHVSDYDLAEILAKGSGEAFAYLNELGVPFAKRADGRADQFVTDGSIYPRACYTGPHTANHIEEALVKKVRTMDIDIVAPCMIADLILSIDGESVVGAVGVLENKNEFVIFDAKAIVLGTGGAGQVFKVNVFPEGMTGDGYAMAYRAGAELVNLEFIQFGLSSVKTNLACSGSMMRAMPKWINDDGREFLRDYFPAGANLNDIYSVVFNKGATWPASADAPSRILDVAVWHELRHGQSVYLDYRANPEGLDFSRVNAKIPQWYREIKNIDVSKPEFASSPLARLQGINPQAVAWLKERGVDVATGEVIEIAPAAQHFQGGVKIRQRGNTTLKGLYAAGEVAGGQHGAMRPGGNSLMDSQVFGKIAGTSAAEEANRKPLASVNLVNSLSYTLADEQINVAVKAVTEKLNAAQGLPATEMRNRVQDILSAYANVVRTTNGLNEGLQKLSELQSQGLRVDEKGRVYALETLNVLQTGMLVLEAARRRPESRGTHLFFKSEDDLSNVPTNDQWQKYIVLKKGRDGITCEMRKPITGE
ncbi:FAD-binding protein [Candidatus Poribacteria bacterium]|nr:FAD-binding protein [Candidatus Poribacteria bacterium]